MSAQGTNIVVSSGEAPDAGTAHFNDDTIGEVSTPVGSSTVVSTLRSLVLTPGSRTIEDFLSKPSRLASGNLSASDTGKLFEIDPYLTLYNTGQKGGKLRGVYLIRADVVVTLQINAVRFQAGRYILAFMPSFGSNDSTWTAKYRMHTANLTTVTQLPHVEIDLAQQTHVTLRIPYVSAYTHLLPGQTNSSSPIAFGALFMVPYWPLIPGSADNLAPYTLWGHFENVELGSVALPQSGYSIGQREAKQAGVGPVSAVAAKVQKTASVLGQIPFLAPATSMVSWLSGITGDVAKVWGFGKPLVQNAPERYHRSIVPYAAVTDQFVTSQPIGLVSTNEVVINNGAAGKEIDEMSFDFIKSTYAYVGNLNWLTSNTADTLLTTLAHRPANYSFGFGKGNVMTPVAFLQTFFKVWRGGLKFRFKLVKTEFHSGRLRISYSPNYQNNATVGSYSDVDMLHQEIVDIRDTSEFEVHIPYISPELYTSDGKVVGTLFIHVVDPLVAPSTVASNVPILVEVAGAPDLEFAIPSNNFWEPYSPVTPMSGYSISEPITLGVVGGDHNIPSTIAIGEKITSFRQILRRLNPMTPTSLSIAIGDDLVVWPYMTSLVTQTTSNTGPLVRGEVYADLFSLVSSCYGLSSGGVVVRAGPLNSGSIYGVRMTLDTNVTAVQYNTAGKFNPDGIRLVASGAVEGFLDMAVPSYHRLLARINSRQATNGSQVQPYDLGANTLRLELQNLTTTTVKDFTIVSRTLGEDGNFSFWLGVPPIVLTSTS